MSRALPSKHLSSIILPFVVKQFRKSKQDPPLDAVVTHVLPVHAPVCVHSGAFCRERMKLRSVTLQIAAPNKGMSVGSPAIQFPVERSW
jgi:hypothetical protein